MGKELAGYPSIDKPWLKYFEDNADKNITENIHEPVYCFLRNQNVNRMNYIALEYFGV